MQILRMRPELILRKALAVPAVLAAEEAAVEEAVDTVFNGGSRSRQSL